ncbi:hypothetical protein BaRGS_00038829 [Batillaria attramentaria]|uniref:Fibrinogen C-terminal domain-containing protein n=1 Tax=Batillaria attramentaria TaxID=370345 RepID=A0ABD0J517_9CAEN
MCVPLSSVDWCVLATVQVTGSLVNFVCVTMAAYMVATLLVAFTFVQNSVAFQWRSTFDLASGHLIRACGVQDVSLPWEYYASNGEQIIDVEWNFDRTGPFPKHEVLASYVRGTFLTNSDLPHHVTFKPNAGIQLSNMTPEQSGRYSVVVHIEKYGIVNTYTRSCRHTATCCEADAAMLRENVQELEAERAALNRSNTYLSARASLLQRLLDKRPSSCEDLQYVNSTSGLTMIYPDNETETGISVYCDQDTDGGGWARPRWNLMRIIYAVVPDLLVLTEKLERSDGDGYGDACYKAFTHEVRIAQAQKRVAKGKLVRKPSPVRKVLRKREDRRPSNILPPVCIICRKEKWMKRKGTGTRPLETLVQVPGAYLPLHRKTIKWWKKLSFHLLTLTMIQSRILYNKHRQLRNLKAKQLDGFVKSVCNEFAAAVQEDDADAEPTGAADPDATADMLRLRPGDHFPVTIPPANAEQTRKTQRGGEVC